MRRVVRGFGRLLPGRRWLSLMGAAVFALCLRGAFAGEPLVAAQQSSMEAAEGSVPAQDAPGTKPAAQVAVTPPAAEASGGRIRGTVKAGTVPLPGVAVTATNTLTGKRYATTTDVTGAFAMVIPRNGRYVVRAELAAFASVTEEVLLNAQGENGGRPEQVAEFSMQLASRVAQQDAAAQSAAASVARAGSGGGGGLQSLSVLSGVGDAADASAGVGNAGAQLPSLGGLGAGDAGAGQDAVTVSGQMGQTNGLANFNEDDIRQRVEDAIAQARRQGGATGDMANAVAGMLGGMMGPGGFGGGFGGGGGGRGPRGGGGFRGLNPTQPHGGLFYTGGFGALNATQYSLTGAPVPKPSYNNNRFGVNFTGSPYIPGLTKPSTKQFVFFNVTGQRNINPLNLYATVPTVAERSGNFRGLTQTVNGRVVQTPIYDPLTGQQFVCNGVLNVICPGLQSKQALALLNFYPAPNVTSSTQRLNYQRITTAGQNATQASLRFVRNLGQTTGFGGGGGRRQQQQANGPKALLQSVNFNGSYSHSASDQPNVFALLGGATQTDGYGVSAGYTVGFGRLTNNASINWNRSHATGRNYFTNTASNPAGDAGIAVPSQMGVGAQPAFYNGLPAITITNFSSLNDARPRDAINQTISFSDFVSWSHKKHNMRFGVDVRRVHADVLGGGGTGGDPLGTFVFSDYATLSPGDRDAVNAGSTVQPTSGAGFADFLLGLPQQTKIQAGLNKIYLRANVYDWYAQDDWRLLPSLTLNYGLRYEYFSPYVEKNNRLVNLDHNANFTEVTTVLPGAAGEFSGKFPRSLVNPDRTSYSPRLGFAWRPKYLKNTVVRGGSGINYNTGQFATFGQSLAFQPPFAVTQTNVLATVTNQTGCTLSNMTLANGFGCSTKGIQNNYSVNKDYRLGRVQVWNLDIQRSLPMGVVLNIGYNGSVGGNLDIVRAPNHTTSSVTTAGAQAFTYEDSIASSRFNTLVVNARKRMQKGISLQATYRYGHSIDNASSIGGTGSVNGVSGVAIAQNDQRLDLEEGNSAFDKRHEVTGNWVMELPFGPNRAFFSKGGRMSKALDGFSVSGDFDFATGLCYTPQYISTAAQIAAGGTYTLRPDRVFGTPIRGNGNVFNWFNKAAFVSPENGFGTASRNSIEGPGTVGINASLSRTVALGETRSFEGRVTANNVFNTVQYSSIDTALNSATFGQVVGTAAQRALTFTARYRF